MTDPQSAEPGTAGRREAGPHDAVDLLFTGTIFCDIVFSDVPIPDPGTEVYASGFALSPGGAANRAVAAARLGSRTALLSTLGTDPFGRIMAEMLEAEPAFSTDYIGRRPGWQTPVSASLTGAHDRSFITYEEPSTTLDWPIDAPAVGAASVYLQDMPEWVKRLRTAGTTIVSGVGWDSTGAWDASRLDALCDVDVFIPNDVEAMNFTRTTDAEAAVRALGERVPLAVVTRGPHGVLAFDSRTGEFASTPTIAVDAVDPTGAGDVFTAAFMSTHADDWPLLDRLRLASLCASLSVRSLGGAISAPRPTDILTHLSTHRPDGDWSSIRAWAEARHTALENAS